MDVMRHFYMCQKSQIIIQCKKNRQHLLKESIARHTRPQPGGHLEEPKNRIKPMFKNN